MSDENPQDPGGIVMVADQPDGQGAKVEAIQPAAASAGTGLVSQPLTQEIRTPAVNPLYVYGAIAAVIGIAVGLAVASLAGGAAPGKGASASVPAHWANSNGAAQAAGAKPQAAPPADTKLPVQSAAAQTPPDLPADASRHRRAKKKDVYAPQGFAIEGDDELVGYDPSKGVIQTSARKTFLVTKASADSSSSAWQEWPANIHYKCDQNSLCTLTRTGGAVLYAQLKK